MALVGIVSDTHSVISGDTLAALAEVDYIIHAGDIGNANVLYELEALAPTVAVLGNNDFDEYGSDVQYFAHPVIEGVRFLVAHFPRHVKIGFNGCAALAAGDPLPQVCVHGHTHLPKLLTGTEARPAQYVICPGSVSFPRGNFPRSLSLMEIEDGQISWVRIMSLNGTVLLSTGDDNDEKN